MLRFFSGVVVGIWIAQNYSLPDVGNEISRIHTTYIKPHEKPSQSNDQSAEQSDSKSKESTISTFFRFW